MLRIETAPYALVEPHREIVACGRCDRYTPAIVAKLREGIIQSHASILILQGMSEVQARIIARGQLESWENREFEEDLG